ncbi:MAG: exodeoxyribonuclease VII small subunit [Bacteroidaceae bacterium]|jgi:exodeoxyribonuclease VII small subunit|nr:exodeoxyribonuclease VII small subunit [Bacteroidaceae bacterium]
MKKMTYAEAMARLEEIMGKVQGGRIDIDELAGLLKEAQELVKFCREKLYKVDEDIKALTEEAESCD